MAIQTERLHPPLEVTKVESAAGILTAAYRLEFRDRITWARLFKDAVNSRYNPVTGVDFTPYFTDPEKADQLVISVARLLGPRPEIKRGQRIRRNTATPYVYGQGVLRARFGYDDGVLRSLVQAADMVQIDLLEAKKVEQVYLHSLTYPHKIPLVRALLEDLLPCPVPPDNAIQQWVLTRPRAV